MADKHALIHLHAGSRDLSLLSGSTFDDLSAIVAWVASKRASEHTRRAFGFEARRWLAWLMWVKGVQPDGRWLDKATSLDAAAYGRYLAGTKDHPMPEEILARSGLQRQPFKLEPLASASVDRAISSLKTMYADLVMMRLEGTYIIERNPWARFKVDSVIKKESPRERALTALERGYIGEALDAIRNEGGLLEYHQLKWIWTALLCAALRRHELAAAVAGDIFYHTDDTGESTWMIRVNGKGGKTASVPLSEKFMSSMREYRAARGLPAQPMGGRRDLTPLVLPMRGAPRNVHPETVYRATKALFARASEIARAAEDFAAADRLDTFASHSARHTQVTMIVDATGDLTLGQDMARHASIVTTSRYKAKSMSRLKRALDDVDAK